MGPVPVRVSGAARWALVVLLLLTAGAAAALYYVARESSVLRDRVIAALNGRFESEVTLDTLKVTAFPKPGITGSKLELKQNGRPGSPPLIAIREFSGTAGLRGLFASPLHLDTVTLDGVTILITPGAMAQNATVSASASGLRDEPKSQRPKAPSLVVDRIDAGPVWLEIASRNPMKPPRIFDIHRLEMRDFRPDDAATFNASLTNAIPTGEIVTRGTFGPYIARDPSKTPITGQYALERAQLDDIKGLGGTLASTGSYDGTLERLRVEGETRSNNFAIDVSNQPVTLNTRFIAIVDATNGDTQLEQVQATLLRTRIDASGAVVRARDVKGRHVQMDVRIQQGHIDDLLALALKPGKAPLTGNMLLTASLLIPAGEGKVIDRMQLAGDFSLSQARFASFNVQQRLNVLSERARGDEEADGAESVVSNMAGRFAMRNGSISFSRLTFAVPGARVELTGTYAIASETMNFSGELLMDATLADTTSGIKSLAARLVQPFFRRPGGGSKLPIRITGTRDKPQFGLDLKRAFLPG